MPDLNTIRLAAMSGLDPEILQMLELYFGSMNRLPQMRSRGYREPRAREAKPTTKLRQTVSVRPEDIIQAGGLPVEAEDISRHFNQAMAEGRGMRAFDFIPPELQSRLLEGMNPPKRGTKKLLNPDKFAQTGLAAEAAKAGVPKNAASMIIDNFLKGNWGSIPPGQLNTIKGLPEAMQATGLMDDYRAFWQRRMEQERPRQRFLEVKTDYDTNKRPIPRSTRYLPIANTVDRKGEGGTYWERRQNTPMDYKSLFAYKPQERTRRHEEWTPEGEYREEWTLPWEPAPSPSIPSREEMAEYQKQPIQFGSIGTFLRRLGFILPGDPESYTNPSGNEFGIPTPRWR